VRQKFSYIERFMWEEHPEYQKSQMRLIGWIVAAVIVYFLIWAAVQREWDIFFDICLVVGGVALVLSLLVGLVWLVVKILTR